MNEQLQKDLAEFAGIKAFNEDKLRRANAILQQQIESLKEDNESLRKKLEGDTEASE